MPGFVIPPDHYSEESIDAAKHLMEDLRHNRAVDASLFKFVNSLRMNDGLLDVYYANPREFTKCCIAVVRLVEQKHPELATGLGNKSSILHSMFGPDYSMGDLDVVSIAQEKDLALVRVRQALTRALPKILNVAPEHLAAGITGCLAQQLVPPADDADKIFRSAREKEAFERLHVRLKPVVEKALMQIPGQDRAKAKPIIARIIHDVVCSDWYLRNLQQSPPYLAAQKAALGGTAAS